MNFKNTAYIIMGGTTGMGLAAALALVNQGAKVLVVGRNKDSCDKAKQLLGAGNLAMNGDATDPESMEKAIQLAHDTFEDHHRAVSRGWWQWTQIRGWPTRLRSPWRGGTRPWNSI